MDDEPRQLQYEDMPAWMHPRRRRIDLPLVMIIVLGGMLAAPWMLSSGSPHPTLSEIHIARIAEKAQALQTGELYSRWAEHFHFGYGSPLFNYLAPVPYLLGALHMVLFQGSPSESFSLLVFVSIIGAGTGTFLFLRQRWGALTGVIGAALYWFAPPLLHNTAYREVDLPLLMAAALFPWSLWACDRLFSRRGKWDALLWGMSAALLVGTSTLMGPLLLLLVVLWALWVIYIERVPWRGWLLWGAGLLWALGVTMIYWLPALAEAHAVYWTSFEPLIRPLTLSEVLSVPTSIDPQQLNPQAVGSLGVATWGTALLGAGILLRRPLENRVVFPFLLFAIGLLGVAAALPSAWLDSISTFPNITRLELLVPAAACCAIVGAQAAYALHHPVARGIGVAVLVILIAGLALPTLTAPRFKPYQVGDALDHYLRSELEGALAGSFPFGLLLPQDTTQLPPPSNALVDSYFADRVSKFGRANRVPAARLSVVSHSPTEDVLRLNVQVPTTLQILTLNFLGWKASFVGDPIPVQSSPSSGLIQVQPPLGSGDLRIFLGTTPARSIGMVGSLLCLVGLPLLLVVKSVPKTAPEAVPPRWQLSSVLAVLVLMGAVGVARLNVLEHDGLTDITTFRAVFGEDVVLLGYHLDDSAIENGGLLSLSLYWEPERAGLRSYHVEVQLLDANERPVAKSRHRAPGGYLTSLWQPGRYVEDTHWLSLPSNLSPGTYQLAVQVLRCSTLDYLTGCPEPIYSQAVSDDGNPLGEKVSLPLEVHVYEA